MAPPSKLTPELVDRMVAIFEAGGLIGNACAVAGITHKTYCEWMKRGDPEGSAQRDAPFREFRERVTEARQVAEARNVAIITTAAAKDWRAAAWLLERQAPEKWVKVAASRKAINNDASEDPKEPSADPLDALDELAPRRARRTG